MVWGHTGTAHAAPKIVQLLAAADLSVLQAALRHTDGQVPFLLQALATAPTLVQVCTPVMRFESCHGRGRR